MHHVPFVQGIQRLSTHHEAQILTRQVQIHLPLHQNLLVRTLNNLVECMEFVPAESCIIIQVKHEEVALTCAEGSHEITNESILFLRPLNESVYSLQHWEKNQHSKQHVGVLQEC